MSITPAQNPFHKISTTLLQAVFGHLCRNEPVYLPLQHLDVRYTLGLVCKRWNNIIWSTYSFWATVHFIKALPYADTCPPELLLSHFAYCTVRSGRHPLDITFDMVYNGWDFSIVRSVIIPHIHRIKTLSCPIYGNNNIIEFLTIPEGSFRILESIEVWLINTLENPASSFPFHISLQFGAFLIAPRLCEASIHLSNGLHPTDLRLPWDQLTMLDLGSTAMAPAVFIEVMQHTAQRLEDAFCKIRFDIVVSQHFSIWLRSIKMRALKTLRLRLLFPTHDTRLFSLLRLPCVEFLRLEMHDQFQDWDMQFPFYTELLQASTKSLRQLHLIDYPYPGSPDELDNSLVVRRRHSDETDPQTLDKFFTVVSNVQNLHLPIGLDVHAATLEKISICTLLPQIRLLELGTMNGRPILEMARRRHARWLHASLAEGDFETDRSQLSIRPLGIINILIPHHGYNAEEKAALMEEAQALRALDIKFYVHTTLILPLPKLSFSPNYGLVTQPIFPGFRA